MTDDEERELFREIARIDRRIGAIGGIVMAAISFTAAFFTYHKVMENWGFGETSAFWIAGAVDWYLQISEYPPTETGGTRWPYHHTADTDTTWSGMRPVS
jgi:hypothetical protein